MPTIERATVLHIAKLARVALTEEEIDLFRTQLSDIIGHFDVLNAIDTEGVRANRAIAAAERTSSPPTLRARRCRVKKCSTLAPLTRRRLPPRTAGAGVDDDRPHPPDGHTRPPNCSARARSARAELTQAVLDRIAAVDERVHGLRHRHGGAGAGAAPMRPTRGCAAAKTGALLGVPVASRTCS